MINLNKISDYVSWHCFLPDWKLCFSHWLSLMTGWFDVASACQSNHCGCYPSNNISISYWGIISSVSSEIGRNFNLKNMFKSTSYCVYIYTRYILCIHLTSYQIKYIDICKTSFNGCPNVPSWFVRVGGTTASICFTDDPRLGPWTNEQCVERPKSQKYKTCFCKTMTWSKSFPINIYQPNII